MSNTGDKSADNKPDDAIDSIIAKSGAGLTTSKGSDKESQASSAAQSSKKKAAKGNPAQADLPKTSGVKKKRSHIVILLLFLAIAIGALLASGQQQLIYEIVRAQLNSAPKQPQVMPDKVAPVLAAPASKAPPAPPKRLETAVVESPAIQRKLLVSSKDVRELLFTIDHLRAEIGQLEHSQALLQQNLLEQQNMNLQVRLRWITDPASSLAQLQLAWEEISLLSGLSDNQRQQAIEMHALARARMQQLKQWQAELKKWADVLSTPVHANIIPQPQQAWLAWLTGQFQLRQAPSQEARQLTDLRVRLLDSARQLGLETWPAQGVWQRLHAELLLQIKAIHQDNPAAAVETGLPESFDGIASDISALRAAAQHWILNRQQGQQQPDQPQDNNQWDDQQGGEQ